MAIGELKETISQQEKQINELLEKNNKIAIKNKELMRIDRAYYNFFMELLNNNIDFKEFQTLYNQIETILKGQDITKELKQTRYNTNNDYLFNFVMSLFEYKPF